MITDFTDAFGKPIFPGCKVVVATATYGGKTVLRKGTVYRVGLRTIGVDVERPSTSYERGPNCCSYKKPKNFVVVG